MAEASHCTTPCHVDSFSPLYVSKFLLHSEKRGSFGPKLTKCQYKILNIEEMDLNLLLLCFGDL